ncbi:MAG: cysteine desulfurase family protein [Candidatus Omnitrophota bacterium]|nr:cysteine desulfurase [Candidatus Omnitrophota bacterium]MBU1928641.1 cysteine desulfurase [Candidatus Omnitrophota bacterium]MBU2034741.1 cysteine desulfurase [Candidatus Omnitrophota bacterium]MBU2222083.1 cysteine desulfurase [Candidatus Omnitrophota bacterium]MBU2257665.1 cysteine desulfurase [Candidatus Omnitrophota bacterium]
MKQERKRKIYLDHNATTPLHPEVKKALIAAMEVFGNPSSLHQFGREARKLVEEARGKVASFINASPEEIIFVGSGSEANNTVINLFSCQGFHSCDIPGLCVQKKEIITTKIEHPCVLESAACLKEKGAEVCYVGVDQYGKINLAELKSSLSEHTGLVSVMTANNEIGTIQDIKKVSNLVHAAGGLLHTDAVQAVGKIPIDVKSLEADYLSFSAHKIYGPKGIGALYIRKGAPFCQFIRGGHQEKGRRAGTENTLGIVGLGKAIEMRKKEMADEFMRLEGFKKRLKEGIQKNISDIRFNGHPTEGLPGTLNVSLSGAEGEAMLLYLDMEGIAVSTGSACASGSLDPSHVLMATGIPQEQAHGSIRMSMGRDTKEKDIDYVIDKLTQVVKRVRKISSVSTEVKHG